MTAVDSSVVVAAFSSWHEGHSAAKRALQGQPDLPAHAAVESFSVLTRLPPPHRAPADLVRSFLHSRFRRPYLALPAEVHKSLIDEITGADIRGGAVYDALVGATSRHAGVVLLSRDLRAVRTYAALGIDFELVE